MAERFPDAGPSSPGGDAPLQMLSAGHRETLRQCHSLQQLAARLRQGLRLPATNASLREQAMGIVHYFDAAAVQQHADEEDHLFPAILESVAGSDPVCIRDLIDQLSSGNRRLEAAWRRLRPALHGVSQGGTAPVPDDAIAAFVSAYEAHVDLQENELMPLAQRLLGQHQIDALGLALGRQRTDPGA